MPLWLKIQNYISEAGIKQSFLAKKMNLPQATISAMLSGNRKITAEEYFLICQILGVGVEKFAA